MVIVETNLKFKSLKKNNLPPSMIVLHHSDSSKMNVLDIHKCHQDKGWSGIGYHFFISKEGSIYKGRPLEVIGAHCEGFNLYSIGICAQGNYMAENMPIKQQQAIVELCKYLCETYKIKMIKGHKEMKSTLCPGIKYPLKEIRTDVFSQIRII